MIGALGALIGKTWTIVLAIIILLVFLVILWSIYVFLGPIIIFGLMMIGAGILVFIKMPGSWKIALLPISFGIIIILLSVGGLI